MARLIFSLIGAIGASSLNHTDKYPMNKPFQMYHIKLDGRSRAQLDHAKQTVNEITGARFSNAELVRYGIDLASRDIERLMSNPNGLSERLINKVGRYRWARSANNTQRK